MVEAVSTVTTGAKMAEMAEIRADSPMARDSDFFMASRLGTSSPKTKVK